MRRIFSVIALAGLLLVGCNGEGGDKAASPLDEALGYLPKNAPLVMTFETDLEGSQARALDRILDRFPAVGSLEDSLEGQFEGGNVDFDKDVKPLLGNEFIVGATNPQSIIESGGSNDFVGAIQVKDGNKLDGLIKGEKLKEEGEKSGAKVYTDSDGDAFAIKDDVLIVAATTKQLEDALAQREQDDRLDESTFNAGLEGLPEEALVRVFGDLQTLIARDPDTKDARKVEWVDALRTFGLTAVAKSDEVELEYRLTTEGELSEADLPLAPGAESPGVLRLGGQIGAGLRGLDQIFKFGEAAAQAIDPQGYGEYAAAKRALERQLDIDVDRDVVEQLDGEVNATTDIKGNFAVRADLKDPDAFAATLRKLEAAFPELSGSLGEGTRLVKEGDLYRLAASAGSPIFFGVVGGKLVVSNTDDQARAVARIEPRQVQGAEGAIVVSTDAQQLTNQILAEIGGTLAFGGLVTGPLGDLTSSTRIEPDGLSGSTTLSFD